MLLSEPDRRKFLRDLRRPHLDNLRKLQIAKKVNDQCKKTKTCFECGAVNGVVRKAGTNALKVSHDKFRSFNSSTAKGKIPPPSKVLFDQSFEEAKKQNVDIDRHFKKVMDDLNPLRVLKIFKRISTSDCELLGLGTMRPETFLWLQVPAPPVCIRPSVGQEAASTEDDITAKLGDIISANVHLREALKKGAPVSSIVEHWDYLSLQIAMYINSDVPGLAKGEGGKQIRGFVQRLKGKQGRFRGNLSGKRVDFSGRTVISPDPNLSIDEVAVPILVAKNMTYPERVTRYNIEKLRERVRNGANKWPGANAILKAPKARKVLTRWGNPEHMASELQEGDVVERHLEDGDIVLFNRQPSLHKLSILSHFVKVREHRTFRLNECVCNPYNADFDGDEMNLHVPQTEEARTEARQLMGVKHNIVTPKNGEPIISAIQDFITASWLMTYLDRFYDRKTFINICLGMLESETQFDLPPPTIIKPQALWTGKQVFNVLMSPNRKTGVNVNIDAECRDFKALPRSEIGCDAPEFAWDSYLCIRNSEVICGRMDKSTVGSGKKNSLFYILYRDYGPDAAVRGMNRLSRLSARWLGEQGFSIGISDVIPGRSLVEKKEEIIASSMKAYDAVAREFEAGRLKRAPGQDEAQTLESQQSKILSDVRTQLSKNLTIGLTKHNAPMVMAQSGSKGSTVNVAQMVALLGQQDIEGKRVQDGFQDRTLPHFAKHARTPASKGFVRNSFFSGLTPYEFIFHGQGGRVGLVDTAVKTAETGYMSRRLMKSLEDLSTQYDETVRNSASNVVQFQFGDDKLDPVDMEADAQPVSFTRTFTHVNATTFNMEDESLSPEQIRKILHEMLEDQKAKTERRDWNGGLLPYDLTIQGGQQVDLKRKPGEKRKTWPELADGEHKRVDNMESLRDFIHDIEDFVEAKARDLEKAREEKSDLAFPPKPPTSSLESTSKSTQNSSRGRGKRAATDADPATTKRRKGVSGTPVATRARGFAKASTKDRFDLTSKISEVTLRRFIQSSFEKYYKAQVEPGHAVGAVGAQSIGEPGTQMTLKTFHFAGVAGMSLTQGVPRIKEIINASKEISTPVITCVLHKNAGIGTTEDYARVVKGRIEGLFVGDIADSIEVDWRPTSAGFITINLSTQTKQRLFLEISRENIRHAIQKHRRVKGIPGVEVISVNQNQIRITIGADEVKKSAAKSEDEEKKDAYLQLEHLKRLVTGIQVLGHPTIGRVIVHAEELKDKPTPKPETSAVEIKVEGEEAATTATSSLKRTLKDVKPIIDRSQEAKAMKLLVEGYGLRYCLNIEGVDKTTTTTNSIMETLQVLGIEAARAKIVTELQSVMNDLSIDPRHMALLADVMTYKGEVLGITRFGLAKMRDSVLQLASFEKTADHVFDAGAAGKTDKIEGVSECVIVGKKMGLGTGSVEVVRNMYWKGEDKKKQPTLFEDCWRSLHEKKRRFR